MFVLLASPTHSNSSYIYLCTTAPALKSFADRMCVQTKYVDVSVICEGRFCDFVDFVLWSWIKLDFGVCLFAVKEPLTFDLSLYAF